MWTDEQQFQQVEPSPSPDVGGDSDSLRQYLRQIGRVPLLKAAEERALCAQLEAAQQRLSAALLAFPDTRLQLRDAMNAIHGDPATAARLLESPDGRPLGSADVSNAMAAFSHALRTGAATQRLDDAIPRHARGERARLESRAERLDASLVRAAELIPLVRCRSRHWRPVSLRPDLAAPGSSSGSPRCAG
jgi:hypothetical protein